MAQLVGDEGTRTGDVAGATALLAAVGAGCEESWRRLVDRHLAMVHAICAGFGLQPAAAAEVNQAVWLRFVEHLPWIRTPEAIGGWIAATTRSLCLDPGWSGERSGYTAATVGHTPAAVGCPRRRRGQTVASAFGRLGAQCQRLLRLAATRPRPSDEDLGAALDLPHAQVEPTCTRCLHRLGRMIGVDSDAVWAQLQDVIATGEGVPGEWRAATRTAFGWLTDEAEPAERLYDATSSTGPSRSAGAVVRQVRCATRQDGIEMVLDVKGDEIVMQGHVLSGVAAKLAIRWPGGEVVTSTDELGGFRVHDLPRAPLYVHLDVGMPLKTPWLIP